MRWTMETKAYTWTSKNIGLHYYVIKYPTEKNLQSHK